MVIFTSEDVCCPNDATMHQAPQPAQPEKVNWTGMVGNLLDQQGYGVIRGAIMRLVGVKDGEQKSKEDMVSHMKTMPLSKQRKIFDNARKIIMSNADKMHKAVTAAKNRQLRTVDCVENRTEGACEILSDHARPHLPAQEAHNNPSYSVGVDNA